jgi:hypothetical protein
MMKSQEHAQNPLSEIIGDAFTDKELVVDLSFNWWRYAT